MLITEKIRGKSKLKRIIVKLKLRVAEEEIVHLH